MQTLPPPNLADRRFKADPFPYYARLREAAPVCRVALPNAVPAWLVTRYDDCLALLKDTERFVKDPAHVEVAGKPRRPAWMPGFLRPLSKNMLDLDDPDHARLRRVVHKAFTPKLVERLRGQVEAITDRLLARASQQTKFDLIHDFALPLPVEVISEMIGVDEADRARFHTWSSRIVVADTSGWHSLRALPSAIAFLRYARRLIRDRRSNPREDLTTALVQAEDAGDTLSEDETLSMLFLLLVAGHETTVNLIGNGVLTLLSHPAQLTALRNTPSLLKPAIEELLRFDGPVVMSTERYAREETEFAGTRIPAGALIYAVLASANRDHRQFERPDELILDREPNRHLAFGFGSHFCLGAPLARLESHIAIGQFLQRFPALRLAAPRESLRWRRGLLLRGVERMPVLLHP